MIRSDGAKTLEYIIVYILTRVNITVLGVSITITWYTLRKGAISGHFSVEAWSTRLTELTNIAVRTLTILYSVYWFPTSTLTS